MTRDVAASTIGGERGIGPRCLEAMMTTNPRTRGMLQSSRQETRPVSHGLATAGGVAAILAGLVMGVNEAWDDRVPGVQEGVVPSALHTAWVGLIFVALLGLAKLQHRSFGRFGRIATVVALVGTGTLTVLAFIETLRYAGVLAKGQGDPALPMMVLLFTVIGCYVGGLLLFGTATIMARVLPRSAGALLVLAVLLKVFASGVVPGTLALMGAAFVWLGTAGLLVMRTRGPVVFTHPADA
jgi:hypothetical protein